MNNEVEYFLEEIANNLEKIVEQLEIINSPEKDKEFNKWFYIWNKRVQNTKDLIKLYTESNRLDRVQYYTEELEKLEKESFRA